MKTHTRAPVAAAVGFVVWRISVELMPILVALALGLIAAGAAWTLTAPRTTPSG